MDKSPGQSYLYALGAVLLWSTVATAFSLALDHFGFLALLLVSSATAFLFLLVYTAAAGRLRGLLEISKRDILLSMLYGFLNPFLYYLVLFKAYSILPAQIALSLNYTWAIVLVIFSVFFLRQKIRPAGWLALLISFSGVVLIASRGNFSSLIPEQPFGVALALGSSIIWALYWVLNTGDKLNTELRLMLNFFFGALYALPVYAIFGGSIKIELNIGYLIYIGLFEMGVTFILWIKALKTSVKTSKVSNLAYLSPFLSLLWLRLITGEELLLSSMAGLALIVAGIIFQASLKDLKA
ncbi:MAG: DMT family transporter [Candidatus Kapaibacterium sp.]